MQHTRQTEQINAIHQYWFGPLNTEGLADPGQAQLWFRKSEATDRYCREHFTTTVGQALRGGLDGWVDSDRGLIALIVVLDQFTRNIHRDTAQAFSGDQRALQLAQGALTDDRHRSLPAIHRVFLYLPLEHAEDLSTQQACVALFTELVASSGDQPELGGYLRYAIAHRDVIARFGRFPHRNKLLGRPSTAEELDYLAEHGGF